eukprot:COSAG01_NODE_225_length_21277_cov_71.340023_8_plen_67_part_00
MGEREARTKATPTSDGVTIAVTEEGPPRHRHRAATVCWGERGWFRITLAKGYKPRCNWATPDLKAI